MGSRGNQFDIPYTVQDSFHIVLVEPGESLNIGSVARAMDNLGFSNLDIVAAPRFDRDRAERTACHAVQILENAVHYSSLEDALAQRDDVVGFTSSGSRNRRSLESLGQWIQGLDRRVSSSTAIVFGPEDTGLRREHLAQCRKLVCIPSSNKNTSYNLAQAVLLVLFQIVDAGLIRADLQSENAPATWNQMDQVLARVTSIAEQVGFYRDGSSDRVPELVQNLVHRIQPDQRELEIILALISRVERTLGRLP